MDAKTPVAAKANTSSAIASTTTPTAPVAHPRRGKRGWNVLAAPTQLGDPVTAFEVDLKKGKLLNMRIRVPCSTSLPFLPCSSDPTTH